MLRAYPAANVNVATLAREDDRWALWHDAIAPLFAPDTESVWPGLPGGAKTFTGLDGIRAAFGLDCSVGDYRTEVERAVDCGERVVLLALSFGRLAGSEREVRLDGASAWTVDDGKISWSYHSSRADVLKLVGLEQ